MKRTYDARSTQERTAKVSSIVIRKVLMIEKRSWDRAPELELE